jgi:hypothetical protein
MSLHRQYYSDGAGMECGLWTPLPYRAIQRRIGMVLKEQYEPPKDLPHQLLALLIEVENSEDDR